MCLVSLNRERANDADLLTNSLIFHPRRGASFKEDEGTWKGNDDGKVVNNQPQRVMDDRNGLGPQGGYIAKITNDARETEMEENMGQVNTMIGNLRNMAIDMGSELENQNRQIDRINRKVRWNDSRVRRVLKHSCSEVSRTNRGPSDIPRRSLFDVVRLTERHDVSRQNSSRAIACNRLACRLTLSLPHDRNSIAIYGEPETENRNILRFRYCTQRLKRKYCHIIVIQPLFGKSVLISV